MMIDTRRDHGALAESLDLLTWLWGLYRDIERAKA